MFVCAVAAHFLCWALIPLLTVYYHLLTQLQSPDRQTDRQTDRHVGQVYKTIGTLVTYMLAATYTS